MLLDESTQENIIPGDTGEQEGAQEAESTATGQPISTQTTPEQTKLPIETPAAPTVDPKEVDEMRRELETYRQSQAVQEARAREYQQARAREQALAQEEAELMELQDFEARLAQEVQSGIRPLKEARVLVEKRRMEIATRKATESILSHAEAAQQRKAAQDAEIMDKVQKYRADPLVKEFQSDDEMRLAFTLANAGYPKQAVVDHLRTLKDAREAADKKKRREASDWAERNYHLEGVDGAAGMSGINEDDLFGLHKKWWPPIHN